MRSETASARRWAFSRTDALQHTRSTSSTNDLTFAPACVSSLSRRYIGCRGTARDCAVSTMTMPDEMNEKLSWGASSLPTCSLLPNPSTCSLSVTGGSTMICASMTVCEPVLGGMQRSTNWCSLTGSLKSSRVSKK